jgi:hypothetical protein
MILMIDVLPEPERPNNATRATACLELRIKLEASKPVLDVDGEGHPMSSRRLTWRAISSDASSGKGGMKGDMMGGMGGKKK